MANSPAAFDTAPWARPAIATCTSETGRPLPSSVTRPRMVPVACAASGVDAPITSAAAKPTRRSVDTVSQGINIVLGGGGAAAPQLVSSDVRATGRHPWSLWEARRGGGEPNWHNGTPKGLPPARVL